MRRLGSIEYPVPDPSSGIFVLEGVGDGPEGSRDLLFIHNGRSRILYDASAGEVAVDEVEAEDAAVFERVVTTIRKAN